MPVIKVTGNVAEVIDGQYARIKFWEKFDFKGQERNRAWTAWTGQANIADIKEGDYIEIEGSLGTKVATYTPKDAIEPKNVVEHSLNDVSITRVVPKNPTNSAPIDESVPF